jgi:peptidyl-prolyl cis-trans isomerase D
MLRRLAILSATAVSLAGCSNFRDAFSAHADVVARAAGQELTVTRLAELLAPQKTVPLRRDVVDRIADLWVDYQLLAQAVAGGDSLTDTATVMAASWPAVMQRLADQLHDQVIVQKARMTGPQVDSAYNLGAERWIDHLLVAVRQETTQTVRDAKRRIAEGYLTRLRSGTPFARLASEKSDDRATAVNGGSLGLVGRGVLVKSFEDAAWALQPGQTSGLVETPFGYHIIRRPVLADVRDSFQLRLRDLDIARRDSVFLDSLATKTGIKVRGAAPAIVRGAITDSRAAKRSSRVLATYTGGELTARRFARWVQAFPPQTRQMVIQADDSTLKEFVRSIARNEVLLSMVRSRNLQLSPAARDTIIQKFRADFQLLVAAVGVAPESLALDPMALQNRPGATARRVDAYFVGITASPPLRTFYEVPPFLADLLREKYPWNVSTAGVDRALERAKEIRGPETPSAGQPMMQPAPGGPPVGAQPGNAPPRPPLPQGNAPRGAAPTRP